MYEAAICITNGFGHFKIAVPEDLMSSLEVTEIAPIIEDETVDLVNNNHDSKSENSSGNNYCH